MGNLPMDRMLTRFGVEAMLNSGLLLLAVASVGFGLSDSVAGWMFWRSLQGLATAPIYTSISTRLARSFTGEGEFNRVVGLQEVCGNVGVTIGPFLGGTLFQHGGFFLPFAVSAVLHVIFLLVTLWQDTRRSQARPLVEGEEAEDLQDDPSVTVGRVSSCRVLLLGGISGLCLGVWGGYEPILGDYFHRVLGPISQTLTGFLMSLSAVPSTFVTMAVPFIAERLGPQVPITAGLLIYGTGCALLGSASVLPPWPAVISGLLLVGSGWALCWTPVLPTMVETAAARLRQSSGTSIEVARHQVSPPVSSLFNAAAALGEALGPTLGTALLAGAGFQEGSLFLAIFLTIYAAATHATHRLLAPDGTGGLPAPGPFVIEPTSGKRAAPPQFCDTPFSSS
ncbi:unnamed protein product [Effrenium voratum]|uniref:Major facilitator superfamily (MFS) profile domain-containing protein n=1 Tax=Effrenium voratum TaxID=2562239 RepID=A0AA36JG86_9DINO|nr:unnamed protein product [Effrenium voratum]